MKTLSITMIVAFVLIASAFGQEKTGERKWTIDPETGDTIYTESVIISVTEDITPRTSMIIINPLKFLLFYNISYFHKISDGVAFGGGIQFPTPKGISGFGVNAEARFYPTGRNLRGFYFAPNVSYNNLTDDDDDETLSITSIGGLVGWQWFPGDQFAIGLGIGADYYFFTGESDDEDFDDYDGFAPTLRFDIGYAW